MVLKHKTNKRIDMEVKYMRNSKNFIRAISIILMIILLIHTTSVASFATDISPNSNIEPTEYVREKSPQKPKEIKEEIVSKRGPYEKHFLCNDGSCIAATYPEQIHFLDSNNNWVEIDNSLSLRDDRIANQNQELEVSFSKKSDENNMVNLHHKNFELSWSLSFNNPTIEKMDKFTESIMLNQDTSEINEPVAVLSSKDTNIFNRQINSSTATVKSSPAIETIDIENSSLLMSKIQSGLTYKDIYSGNIDASYTVLPNRVKENIILNKQTTLKNYSMLVTCPKLTPIITAENSVNFLDKNNNVQFTIQTPYMFDNIYELSYDIDISIKTLDNSFIITFTPDQEWLNNTDRVYPITIDPTVRTNTTKANFSDTYVYEGCSASSTRCFEERLRVGIYSVSSSYKTHRVFWKVSTLPTIEAPVTITGASFRLTFPSATTTSRTFSLYAVDSNWTSETISWSNMPTSTLLSSYISRDSSTNTVTFNDPQLADTVRSWYNNSNNNYGLMIRYTDESKTNPDYNVAYSSDNTTSSNYMPFLTVTYVDDYASTPISSGIYYIKNCYSNKYLTRNSSNNVVQQSLNRSTDQCWKVSAVLDYYTIEPISKPAMCLDIDNAWDLNGTNVKCHNKSENNTAQRFRIIHSGNDTYRISPECSTTRVLDVCGPSTNDGANIQLWQYENVDQQNWRFYDVSSYIINDINSLHTYAKQYNSNYERNNQLVCQYLRCNAYNNLRWIAVAGAIDDDFIESVNSRFSYLNTYPQQIWGHRDYHTIDLTHMFATTNAILFDSNIIESFEVSKEVIDNLSGWAGDLQQMVVGILKDSSNTNLNDYAYFYAYCMMELGRSEAISKFSMADLLADLDAIYIAEHVTSTSNMGTVLSNYYNNGICNNRFSYFINGRTKDALYNYVYTYTINDMLPNVRWLIYSDEGVTVSDTQASAAAHAFVDFIWRYY